MPIMHSCEARSVDFRWVPNQLMRMMRVCGSRCCPDRAFPVDAHDPWLQLMLMMPGWCVFCVWYSSWGWVSVE